MDTYFTWAFQDGHKAEAILVKDPTDLFSTLCRLGIDPPRPAIVLVGGASGLDERQQQSLEPLFTDALALQADVFGAALLDGGTDSGVMRFIGQARLQTQARFPLIGVLPAGKVALPSAPPQPKPAQLEPHHTHFIFVPGTQWGDESFWIAEIASALTQGLPSVTVLINGGTVAWQDVSASISHDRQVIVINGSGRVADTLAAALNGHTADPRATQLSASGLLRTVNLADGPEALNQALKEFLTFRNFL